MIVNAYIWYMFFAQMVMVFYYLNKFMEPRYLHGGSLVIWCGIVFAWRNTVNHIPNPNNAVLFIVLWFVMGVLVFWCFKASDCKTFVKCYIDIYLVMNAGSFIAAFIAQTITKSNIYAIHNLANYDMTYIIATPICCLIFASVFQTLLFFSKKVGGQFKRGALVMFLLNVYQLTLITVLYANGKHFTYTDAINAIAIVGFSMLINVALLVSVDVLERKTIMEREYKELANKREAEYQNYCKRQNEIEQYRVLRHEYVNSLEVISYYVNSGEEKEKMEKLLNHYLTRIKQVK